MQIIAKWNEKRDRHDLRIEPDSYWVDAINDEEVWDNHLTPEEADAKMKEYHA